MKQLRAFLFVCVVVNVIEDVAADVAGAGAAAVDVAATGYCTNAFYCYMPNTYNAAHEFT